MIQGYALTVVGTYQYSNKPTITTNSLISTKTHLCDVVLLATPRKVIIDVRIFTTMNLARQIVA